MTESKKPKLFLKLPFGSYGLISAIFNKRVIGSTDNKHDTLCPCCCWRTNNRIGRRMWSIIVEDYKAHKLYNNILNKMKDLNLLVNSNESANFFYNIITKQLMRKKIGI